MRPILLIAGALALAFLSACAGIPVTGGALSTTPTTTTVTIESTAVSRLVAQAQSYAKAACGILPAATSLANLVAAGSGTIATAAQLADLACRALTTDVAYAADSSAPPPRPKKARKGEKVEGTVVVNGRAVPVEGRVVK